jgi:hypothetical protein
MLLHMVIDIPIVKTEEHKEHLGVWISSGIVQASLIHVDAHRDLTYLKLDEAQGNRYYDHGESRLPDDIRSSLTGKALDDRVREEIVQIIREDVQQNGVDNVFTNLNIGNFINPAVYLGIVNNVYWINPHLSQGEQFRKMGEDIQTVFYVDGIFWAPRRNKEIKSGNASSPLIVPANRDMILDIDLDGFCTDKHVHLAPKGQEHVDRINGYESRVDGTIGYLRQLPRPKLITLTRSQGKRDSDLFVPPSKVDEVQKYVIQRLQEVYSR